jgi:C-terminal processing protease CtpA/Prc
VLLIDETNFSTAEQFIVALVDSGRATTVGRLTSGGSGNPITFRLPGDGLSISLLGRSIATMAG